MASKDVLNINQFAKWMIEQYRAIQQYQIQNDAVLRIINIEQENKSQDPVLHIQLVGKNYFFKKTLSEVYASQDILEAFSKRDLQTLVKIKTEWDLCPKLAISGHFEKQGIIFLILADSEGNKQVERIEHIAKNKEIVHNLSAKDAYLMGYLLGAEQN